MAKKIKCLVLQTTTIKGVKYGPGEIKDEILLSESDYEKYSQIEGLIVPLDDEGNPIEISDSMEVAQLIEENGKIAEGLFKANATIEAQNSELLELRKKGSSADNKIKSELKEYKTANEKLQEALLKAKEEIAELKKLVPAKSSKAKASVKDNGKK